MTKPLTLNEFKKLATQSNKVVVFKEMPAANLTPVSVYKLIYEAFKTKGVILEHLEHGISEDFSFICFESIDSMSVNLGDEIEPLTALRNLQAKHSYATRPEISQLVTSAIGFMAYDIVSYINPLAKIPKSNETNSSLPIILFNFYSKSIVFNHKRQAILITTLIEIGEGPEKAYQDAQEKIMSIIKVLSKPIATNKFQEDTTYKPTINAQQHKDLSTKCTQQFTSSADFTKKFSVDISDIEFMLMVEKAKDYIIRGDAFQIVLSRCFKRPYSVSPLEIYHTLRHVSPAPFMFYFPTETGVIVGASPERFIRVQNKEVTVNPIAGTKKPTLDNTHDSIEESLLNDKKEIAEHMMLVDLARNDIGAVSEPGSVVVRELQKVKHYSHISHITSSVTGKLKASFDAFDAFAASFPAGTLSGAPKIRAMQIIDELETSKRGLYGGAICRLDAEGNFDSCIAIRMAVLNDGVATIRTGAGIVHDSIPAVEAKETYTKAQSMLDAIAKAHGELYDINY